MAATVAFLWHLHQPDYRDPWSGRPRMPWVRLHALRGYRDLLVELPESGVPHTINLTPSLLDQLEGYRLGAVDDHLERTVQAPDTFSPDDLSALVSTVVVGHPAMRERSPAWRALAARAAHLRPSEVAAIRDLQVWGTLAWFGSSALRDYPALRQLRARGSGFVDDDKAAVLEIQRQVIAEIPALLLALRGSQTRASASPYHHPILPLLVDSRLAWRNLPTRDDAGFRFPEDARWHLEAGRARVAEAVGGAPAGCWPSEGSVAPEVLPMLRAAGYRWFATDDAVLRRSRHTPGDGAGPWDVGGGLRAFFRDHDLSDRVGFSYASRAPGDAAADLLGEVDRRGGTRLIALDGENPWESFPDAGGAFRAALAAGLRSGPVVPVSLDELAERPPVGVVEALHTGSWIGADFRIWYGHEEDRAAWRALAEVRAAIAAAPSELAERALAHARVAEASDWTWWYGDDFDTPFRGAFDALFRDRVRAAWLALGLAAPAALDAPLSGTRAAGRVARALVDPSLDEPERWFDWVGATKVRWPRGSAMARADADVISELDLGFSSNPPALWLCARVTPGVALPDVWVVEVGGRAVRVASDGGRAVIDGLIVAATPRVVVARALLDGLGPEVGYAVHVDTPSGRRSFPPGGGKVAAPSAPALTWWTV